MTVGVSSKAGPKDGPSRLMAHGIGFAGANLIFASVFFWGFPLFVWAVGGDWATTALADIVAAPLASIFAALVGTPLFPATLFIDATLFALGAGAGVAMLVKGARTIARQS